MLVYLKVIRWLYSFNNCDTTIIPIYPTDVTSPIEWDIETCGLFPGNELIYKEMKGFEQGMFYKIEKRTINFARYLIE